MHVCMSMLVCYMCVYAYIHTHALPNAYVHDCTHVHAHTYAHADVHAHAHVYTSVLRSCPDACLFTCLHMSYTHASLPGPAEERGGEGGLGSWQGGPLTPNDETFPSMRSRFHVAVLSSRAPSRTKPPGAPWRASWLAPHPGQMA